MAPPTTASMKANARPRLDLDLDVGELAVAAALPLETRMQRRAFANGFAIGDLRPARLHREVEFVPQPVERDLQMDVALSAQHQLLQLGTRLERQCRILLDQLLDRAGELDVVAAFLG